MTQLMAFRRLSLSAKLSLGSLLVLLVLECIAFSFPREIYFWSSATRDVGIHFSFSSVGIGFVNDPTGQDIPFWKDGWWKHVDRRLRRSDGRFRVPFLFMRDNETVTASHGQVIQMNSWGLYYGPLLFGVLIWPVVRVVTWSTNLASNA